MSRPRSMSDDVRAALRSLGPWGWGALLSVLAAAWPTIGGLVGLTRALASTPHADIAPHDANAARAGGFRAAFADHLTQINGRSMFFVPRPPPAPPPPTETPATPPPPSRYGGPAVIGMINGIVWFDNGAHLTVEDNENAGIRVVSIHPPWSARIEWHGREWDVPLFDRTTEQFLEKPTAEPAQPSSPEPPADD